MSNEERVICETALASIRDAELAICKVALERIRREKRNFAFLASGRQFSKDPLHKKAVTEYSFDELSQAMKYLSHVLEFRDEAMELSHFAQRELARPSEQREAEGILAAIAQFEPRLERRTGGMKGKEGDAVQF